MKELRRKMIADMVIRGMAEKTQVAYVSAVKGLARYYQRSPDGLTAQEIQRYLLYLVEERKLADSTCNQARHGLQFFYRVTLGWPHSRFSLPPRRRAQKLPEILSTEEVRRIIEAARCKRDRVLLMATYAAGLRVSEVVKLRITDIDAERKSIRVEQSKGKKDRYTCLSGRLLVELREYWRQYRPAKPWLFPNPRGRAGIGVDTAQKIFHAAKDKAGVGKRTGIHGLRHAFATHGLEAGVDLHTIQRLLGHTDIRTTMRYFHLARGHLTQTASPLDLIELSPGAPA